MENGHAEIERGNGVELSDFNGWAALHPVGGNKGAVGLMDKGAAFVVYKADEQTTLHQDIMKLLLNGSGGDATEIQDRYMYIGP